MLTSRDAFVALIDASMVVILTGAGFDLATRSPFLVVLLFPPAMTRRLIRVKKRCSKESFVEEFVRYKSRVPHWI